MLSVQDINILGSIIDSTYGRQSSMGGGSSAIRKQLVGDCLVITYHEVVNIAKDRDKIQQVDPCRERAQKLVKECANRIEEEFSKSAGRKLKLKVKSESGELEAMSYNFMSPVRPTLFRLKTTYEIG
jgi:hypothetical protein